VNRYVDGSRALGAVSGTIDPTRCAVLPDEIEFWSRQLSEHALFFHLGIEDEALKHDALILHSDWETFRQGGAAGDLVALVTNLRGFKTMLLDELSRRWIGWIFPLFVEHTRRELDLFVAHLGTSALTPDELCQWTRFMAEHAAFAAHLLDPAEAAKIQEATAAAGQFSKLSEGCAVITPTLVALSQKAGEGLDAWLQKSGLGTPATHSVVHPVLAAHVVREGQRFLQTTAALGGAYA